MGYITYGKTRSKRGQVELVPEEEWIKVMWTYGKLKMPEGNEVIMEQLLKNRMLNPKQGGIFFCCQIYCIVKSAVHG
ncbi:hypothetical protein [Paenibacillus agri]|uniref:Uncharacterized protein n=1 Tax=Paenibacillus agri TaxID=2744309 RepID=A0A850EU60_9BACL|nr:hypothetical protein [Paenibacillus agri]NUU64126.1 hypothetical protein [Paenibacillus agri]